ncbi:heavy-metal-associated domain-containing protein [Actinotignum sanguinis]|uniref:Cation transporter n=2 Tax=Actinomycetaceae TaxID=2049 RepID=A0ABZ0RA92_9ACTO|nr:cation transporter [Actinotignum sanguinis]WPJ88926.1 cation transporter [Schaalia turicensis]MDE1553591.1 cation transporter [Actinotignum sanguinis]MDE1565162.1 cation transporter [Actinotignum sanguinis]MDE1577642.1 cation transporter [Actinotignum sanguinis]MDE1642097.1 cation transporter [Actinotignum sanguinis]
MATEEFDRTIELKVTGMTCENCVKHVSAELDALPDVNSVLVTLNPEGTSSVLVYTPHDFSDADLTAAVAEAGDYTVTEIIR